MMEDYVVFYGADEGGEPVLVACPVPWVRPSEIYATARQIVNEALGRIDDAPRSDDDDQDLILVQAKNLDEAVEFARSILNSRGDTSECETLTPPWQIITDPDVIAEAEAPAIGSGLPSLLEVRLEADLEAQHAAEQELLAAEQELLYAPMKTLIAKARIEVTGLFDMLNRGAMSLEALREERVAKARPLPHVPERAYGALTR